jgi:hypothetical protein
MLTTAKKIYVRNKIRDAGKDSKKIWQTLKETMGLPIKGNHIEQITVDGISITDPILMANKFNEHISSMGERLTPNIPTTSSNFWDFLPPHATESFFFAPTNPLSVSQHILSIKPKPSLDCNEVSMKLLHKVAGPVSIPLSHIYNLSVSEGKFPEKMKLSRAIPIFKSGNPSDIDNYRLVVLIDSFSKVFEKIAYENLIKFLNKANFFSQRQFGFRKNHSTSHCLLDIINNISECLNNNEICLMLLLDIQKCFDLVNREILLQKLDHYGIRGVANNWFKSYFENRAQKVHLNGFDSINLCLILLGILQGSILGVLLFLIFVNDISRACQHMIQDLFAYDNTC